MLQAERPYGRRQSASPIASLIFILRWELDLPTTVVNSDDGDEVIGDIEEDCHTSAETDGPQPRSQIVTHCSPQRKGPEPPTEIENRFDIVSCAASG